MYLGKSIDFSLTLLTFPNFNRGYPVKDLNDSLPTKGLGLAYYVAIQVIFHDSVCSFSIYFCYVLLQSKLLS